MTLPFSESEHLKSLNLSGVEGHASTASTPLSMTSVDKADGTHN